MDIKELDVVTLQDGRQGAIVDVQHDADGDAYLIEIPGIPIFDSPYVRIDDIRSVDWHNGPGK